MLDETGNCDIAINRNRVIYMYVCIYVLMDGWTD